MSKEIDNGGTCPFCFNKVHPQAVACNGCGASYQKEPSRAERLLGVLYFIFGVISISLISVIYGGKDYGVFLFIVLTIAFIGSLKFWESRIKYVWVRRRQ